MNGTDTTHFRTLIVGGGIAGITAAVELAEAGKEVVLLEAEPYLGGNVATFHNYFPKLCPPACGLEINYQRIRTNPRISYYTGARVTGICGSEGDFRVKVSLQPRLINNLCTACGRCAEVCPVERREETAGLRRQKAAYMPGGLAFPMKYTIDPGVCLKHSCARCMEVCDYHAIHLDSGPAEIELHAGRVIVATGWQPFDAARLAHYRYLQEPDVVTNIEFERLLAGCQQENRRLVRPSDGKPPLRIAFVQCAGSRDQNHLPYCSSVCCPASVKHALTLEASCPEIRTEIFYIDLRLTGRNELLLARAEASGRITLTKGKVGRIARGDGALLLEVEDVLAGVKRINSFDMVVLATGLVPNPPIPAMNTNQYGFYSDVQARGVVVASSCKRPMDVSTSVKDATAAALKTMRRGDE
jgi:quinone-modifying oxidoreductase subunit QmoA